MNIHKYLSQNFLCKIGICVTHHASYACRDVPDYLTGKHGKQKLINAEAIYENTSIGDSNSLSEFQFK